MAAGADILDIGGESTRPGAAPVSIGEETDRILPVVEKIDREAHDNEEFRRELAAVRQDARYTYGAVTDEGAYFQHPAGGIFLHDILEADPARRTRDERERTRGIVLHACSFEDRRRLIRPLQLTIAPR